MYSSVRRDEGIDKVRSAEITGKVGDSLPPALRKVPGFSGCYVFAAGEGALTSIGLFEDASQARGSSGAAVTNGVPALVSAPTTSPRETSTSQRPILRTVQGGFHEFAAAC